MLALNPLDGMGAYLKADPAVSELVGSRVYWPALPRNQNDTEPSPTIVLRPAGGYGLYGRGTLALGDTRIDTDCFGATEADSWRVHLNVLAAMKGLKRKTIAGMLLHMATVSAGGVTARDPQTKWPLTIASYTVISSEVPVAA